MAESHPYLRTFVRLLGFLRPYRWSLARLDRARGRLPGGRGRDRLPHRRRARERGRRGETASQLWTIALAILLVGAARAALHGRATADLRPAGARGRVRHARRALREAPSPLVRLLRPAPDRSADVARHGRPPVRALLPRLRAHLLLPAPAHDRRSHDRPLRRQLEARARRDRVHAGPRLPRLPVLAGLAPRPSRRAAADGRRGDGRRGEHRRRPRRQVLRPGGSEAAKFGEKTESVFRRSLDANRQRALYVPLLSFFPLIAQATVLLYGGRMVASGELALDSFFAFNVLVLMLVMPLRMLGMWIGQAQRATASGERIFEVIDESEDVRDASGRARPPARRRAHRRSTDVGLRLRAGTARPRGGRPRDRARADDRADRPHRLGQDDARLARAELLRRHRAAGSRSTAPTSATSELASRCGARSESSPRTPSSSRRPSARTSPSARPGATDEDVVRAATAGAGARVHRGARRAATRR